MEFVKSYGGREKYFKKLNVKDCVTRAICNATDIDYKEIYDDLKIYIKCFRNKKGIYDSKKESPRNGTPMEVTKEYIEKKLEWTWTPIEHFATIGQYQFPKTTCLVQMRNHVTCIKNGDIYDSWDCRKKKDPTIKGYWSKP